MISSQGALGDRIMMLMMWIDYLQEIGFTVLGFMTFIPGKVQTKLVTRPYHVLTAPSLCSHAHV